ncbi:MAG: hypothetical protein OXC19_07465 [Bryobacterales bacterium]|nr:hypothetical protein [Bryobacterales bacterium]
MKYTRSVLSDLAAVALALVKAIEDGTPLLTGAEIPSRPDGFEESTGRH